MASSSLGTCGWTDDRLEDTEPRCRTGPRMFSAEEASGTRTPRGAWLVRPSQPRERRGPHVRTHGTVRRPWLLWDCRAHSLTPLPPCEDPGQGPEHLSGGAGLPSLSLHDVLLPFIRAPRGARYLAPCPSRAKEGCSVVQTP